MLKGPRKAGLSRDMEESQRGGASALQSRGCGICLQASAAETRVQSQILGLCELPNATATVWAPWRSVEKTGRETRRVSFHQDPFVLEPGDTKLPVLLIEHRERLYEFRHIQYLYA